MSERAPQSLDRESAECGECNRPEQFAWEITYMVNNAPVITCKTHGSLAPGWAYDPDQEIAASHDVSDHRTGSEPES